MTQTLPSEHLKGCLCYHCRVKKWDDERVKDKYRWLWVKYKNARDKWLQLEDSPEFDDALVDLFSEIEEVCGVPMGN